MSYENKGSMAATVTVSREPNRSGNWVCSGAADHVELQAAIDYVESLGGGIVHVEEGTYLLTSGLVINTNDVVFEGSGWETILTTSGMTDAFITLDAANLVVRNLKIDCTNQTHDQDGVENSLQGHGILWFEDTGEDHSFPVVENVWVHDASNEGITTFSTDNEYDTFGLVEACRVSGSSYRGIHPHQDSSWTIINNYLTGTMTDGIRHGDLIAGNRLIELDSVYHIIGGDGGTIITGNTLQGGSCHGGIVLWTTDVVGTDGNDIIHGNKFHRIDFNVSANSCGINSGDFGIVEGAIITDNYFFECSQNNMILLWRTSECIISNNHVYRCGAGTDNVYWMFYFLADATGNYVVDNVIWSDQANLPQYCIRDLGGNTLQGNKLTGASTSLVNSDFLDGTIFDSISFQFTEPVVGAIVVTSPTGVDVDANTEAALAWGQLPQEVQEVKRLKIWAVATDAPIGAGGQMHLEVTFNAGASNAAYNEAGKSWNIANFDGEEADYVANDVVHWVIVDGDVGSELLNLVAGDSFEIFAIHEAGSDPDGATDALFRVVEIEYV